ncbi:hypothetical protein [Pseudomonas aeruginosa]
MRVSLQDNPAEEVDSALEKRGLRRQVALTLPHFNRGPRRCWPAPTWY